MRAAKAAKNVDDVWLAVPSSDRELIHLSFDHDISCWCGSEWHVLQRYKDAALAAKADVVVRLTADCPFLDPWIIDQCVERECDSTEFWPDGMDVQVFRPHMLEFGDTEHVVAKSWIRPQLPCPEGNLRHVRVTLDTSKDLERLRLMADRMKPNRAPTWRETLEVVYSVEGAFGACKASDPPSESDILQGLQSVAG